MFGFFRGRQNDPADEVEKRKAAYDFTCGMTHGFPTQPTALDIDPTLELLAVGTKVGVVRIYGAPGVEMICACEEDASVVRVKWLVGRGAIAVLLDTWNIYIFHIVNLSNSRRGEMGLAQKAAYTPEMRVEITSWEFCEKRGLLFCGTDQGDIFNLSTTDCSEGSAQLADELNHSAISENLPDGFKSGKSLGTVEAIRLHPKRDEAVIGYSRGVAIHYDLNDCSILHTFYSQVQLEALDWYEDDQVLLAFQDGSQTKWTFDQRVTENTKTSDILYGPMPCKPITHINKIKDLKIFSGGLPRASFGDRYSVTAISLSAHVVFDLTSRIIDYRVVLSGSGDASALVILCEEELVVVDLVTPNWPVFPLPYLSSPHSTALTACNICEVKSDVLNRIKKLGAESGVRKSIREWPIRGGVDLKSDSSGEKGTTVLLSGHEDGSVRIWNISGSNMTPIYKIATAKYFETDDEPPLDEDIEEWPPFRRVGEFDPYSDDPRLGIRRVDICKTTGALLVGGTAGQVLVFHLLENSSDNKIYSKTVDLVEKNDVFKWKGHQRLHVKDAHQFESAGYQAHCIIQVVPPAAVTSVALENRWGLAGIGTSHGFTLFDFRKMEQVVTRCTLDNVEPSQEGNISRFGNMKQSLRQSMRRIRSSFRSKNRNSRRPGSGRRPKTTDRNNKVEQANRKLNEQDFGRERAIEPKGNIPSVETARQSAIVRVTHFATTYVKDGLGICPTFWVGTAGGLVLMFGLSVPEYNKRGECKVEPLYGKELQLQHRAPVVDISIIDSVGPVSDPSRASQDVSHSLIVTSEEQVKVFSLPKIQPRRKFKLTALEGSLMKKAQLARFSLDGAAFFALVTLTNQGEIVIFNCTNDHKVLLDKRYECMGTDNQYGMVYSNIDATGQGLYLLSPSEFQRFSTNSRIQSLSLCQVPTFNPP